MPTMDFFGQTYEVDDSYILVATRAVKAGRPNLNFDMFEADELKRAASTYDDCDQVFVEHTYVKTTDLASNYEDGIDRSRTRGFVVAEHYVDEDQTLHLLMAIDKRYRQLCNSIMDGSIGSVSMGCQCDLYCSICGTEFDDTHSCECGACPNFIGTVNVDGDLVYDILRNVEFYEISCILTQPAEDSALFYEVVE